MNRREDWFADADVNRAQIFVPALMGAGILVSVFTLARDAMHNRYRRGRARRVALEAHATAHHVLTGEPPGDALRVGIRPRASYLLSGLSTGALAVYVGIGATANYLRPGGYVSGIAWLWALSMATTAALAAVAVACGLATGQWPKLARWQLPLLARTPFGQRPVEPGAPSGPAILLSWAAGAAIATAAVFSLVVAAAPHRLAGLDGWIERTTADWQLLGALGPLAPFGPVPVYLAGIAVIGLSGLRCPALPVAYVAAAAGGFLIDTGLRLLVPRSRPPAGPVAGAVESFPSNHEVQATVLVGFLALALLVLTRRPWLAAAGATAAGGFAIAASLGVLHTGAHWFSDVAGGLLWGSALVLAGWWVLGHQRWHARWHHNWHDCPLARPRSRSQLGVVQLPPRLERAVRIGARTWVPLAVVAFAVLGLTVGLPANPEGDPIVTQVQTVLQIGVLVVAALGWLLALRWEAPGAMVLVLAGALLGALSALAYHPLVSLAVAVVFITPAAAFWLLWQYRRTARAMGVLAITTALLLSGTWIGASAVYDHYYGPAHPGSHQAALPVDRVVWSWTGGVTGRQATIVAELTGDARQARVRLQPLLVGPDVVTTDVAVGADRVVRIPVDGLEPATGYRYRIEVDGVADTSRGAGALTTMPEVAASFTVAFGACAITGSNGAVYDAIKAVNPALYVATGDLHYGNPSQDSVALFANLYRRVLTAPAQAALYRDVPIAYVWDDHDYGPNDAGADSPTRPAARTAYQRYVPHYPLADGPDGAIYQAFTIGRVRFVLTDTRSERTATSLLGDRQREWLERELVTASRTHALVVWVSPDPWIAPAVPGRDDWGGYPDERRRIADVLAEHGIAHLVLVAGGAHRVAIADGTNPGHSRGGRPGFPLLHAAALDRPGSVKGGPYSEGAFPGAGQFGTLSVVDTGGPSIRVTLVGRDWRGNVLVRYGQTFSG